MVGTGAGPSEQHSDAWAGSPPVLFISDALSSDAREGAQVLAGELAEHCRRVHGAGLWGPKALAGEEVVPLLSGRWLGRDALRRLMRRRRARIVYLPQNGLTTATLLRAALLAFLARPRSLDIVVLQHFVRPRRAWRLVARRWSFVVATEEQRALLSGAGLTTRSLFPRVPSAKVSTAPSRDAARERLGWPSGPMFLHVGHARRGRNLRALAPLTGTGVLHLVISDYKPEESDSLPESGPAVQVHRGACPDLADRYRAADVYVFPTFDKGEVIGLPMSIFESLANGTPVVARRSAVLDRWSELPGLHVVDDDDDLLTTAVGLAAQSGDGSTEAGPPADQCLGDLSCCIPSMPRLA